METVPLDRRWKGLIDARWVQALDRTPFLARCRKGTVTSRELRSFVIQQQKYSSHFTRYLCALIANLPEDSDRLELTHNLFEEMGLGEMGSIPHSAIYRAMMKDLGIHPDEEETLPETEALIETMSAACRAEDPVVGLAALCLGAEAIVPHVYSQVVNGFESIGVPVETLRFFLIHIDGDDEHAVTLKGIIDRVLRGDPAKLARLRQTAHALLEARTRFFSAISRNARARKQPGLTIDLPMAKEAVHVAV